jgi:2-dehydropantoate 2-reductase
LTLKEEAMKHLTYAILGAGGIGGCIGAMLLKAGCEVHFVLRSDYGHVKANGFTLKTQGDTWHFDDVLAHSKLADVPEVDVLILLTKTTTNAKLMPEIVAYLNANPQTTLAILQNGMGMEAEFAKHIDETRILGGSCFIKSTKVGPGEIDHSGLNEFSVGQYATGYAPAKIPEVLEYMAKDVAQTKLCLHVLEHLGHNRWAKLWNNCGLNGTAVLLNACYGTLMFADNSVAIVVDVIHEVMNVADAYGVHFERGDAMASLEKWQAAIVKQPHMKDEKPSMKHDFDAGYEMELEYIYAMPIKMAKAKNVPVPKLEMLYQALTFMQEKARTVA